METQTWLPPLIECALADNPSVQPVQASRRDYGFDADEEEIARGMLAPLPAGFSAAEITHPDAGEPEFAQLWFLS